MKKEMIIEAVNNRQTNRHTYIHTYIHSTYMKKEIITEAVNNKQMNRNIAKYTKRCPVLVCKSNSKPSFNRHK